ncbi:uncharacterized protein LOC144118981 [Amblyomma americanum]
MAANVPCTPKSSASTSSWGLGVIGGGPRLQRPAQRPGFQRLNHCDTIQRLKLSKIALRWPVEEPQHSAATIADASFLEQELADPEECEQKCQRKEATTYSSTPSTGSADSDLEAFEEGRGSVQPAQHLDLQRLKIRDAALLAETRAAAQHLVQDGTHDA